MCLTTFLILLFTYAVSLLCVLNPSLIIQACTDLLFPTYFISRHNICTIYIQAMRSPVPVEPSSLAEQATFPWHFTISETDPTLGYLTTEQLSHFLYSSIISLFRPDVNLCRYNFIANNEFVNWIDRKSCFSKPKLFFTGRWTSCHSNILTPDQKKLPGSNSHEGSGTLRLFLEECFQKFK